MKVMKHTGRFLKREHDGKKGVLERRGELPRTSGGGRERETEAG